MVLAHDVRVEFSRIISKTPQSLMALGLYNDLAVALLEGEHHRRVSLALLAAKIAHTDDEIPIKTGLIHRLGTWIERARAQVIGPSAIYPAPSIERFLLERTLAQFAAPISTRRCRSHPLSVASRAARRRRGAPWLARAASHRASCRAHRRRGVARRDHASGSSVWSLSLSLQHTLSRTLQRRRRPMAT